MRSFDSGLVVFEERFDGYRSLSELDRAWYLQGTGTLALCDDPISAQGQGRHVAISIPGAASALALKSRYVRATGTYTPGEATTQVGYDYSIRYRATAGLAGATVGLSAAHSAFGASFAGTVIADDKWHTLSGFGTDFPESSLATGYQFSLSGIPGAGIIRFDDFLIQRRSALARIIDNLCPVFPVRCDWGDGIAETWSWRTALEIADDGTEWREATRIQPRRRLAFTTLQLEDGAESARMDALLYTQHGLRIAVPLWHDALVYAGQGAPTNVMFVSGGAIADRWFPNLQRVMLFDSPKSYEVLTMVLVDPGFIQTSIAPVNTWTPGLTRVVPLCPGRLIPELTVERPTKRGGGIRLTFELDAAARAP